jgi:hypothetical protein
MPVEVFAFPADVLQDMRGGEGFSNGCFVHGFP